MTRLLGALIAGTFVVGLAVAGAAPGIAGKWQTTLETPHGKVALSFELTLDKKVVGGTFTSEQSGTVAIKGEYIDGKLTFEVGHGDLTFAGKFNDKDPDTLSGTLSSPMGDLQCIATRVKDKR